MNSIYVIIHKQEQTFLTFRSKVAWASIAAAKNAYNLHWGKPSRFVGKEHKFDEQDVYEIVELSEVYYRLKDLED